MTIFLKNIGLVLLCLFVLSAADAQETADSTPANCNCGVWVNAGFLSHHIQNDMPRNDETLDLALKYPSTICYR